ncbi:MAG: phosphate acetyltransferase [Candidatus Margulisiibacteriota bacterium]|nr:MAG: phosphate acetyltransferase [Candidatus Margulisbacteria bacterium GWF2_38_17]OGI06030.1 MAG: phosphate acetyltransferase [Candidatus Margulisbacteria bacterium GWE2_39_32]PZM77398.1 MAG: phosphate acetyltransferase [Candidatus Margulisiibacteriota bacterium]HAR64119.1 phosphate acetyltransferase [Candidatus Margulisiibacteriota bacterium]HCT85783.1 phosphate acetyltransferase [Candidatus Margulisiibacteriota bacterium]
MEILESIINRAKSVYKTIVLPESTDPRVVEAASSVTKQKIANVILVGSANEIAKISKAYNFDMTGVTIVDPLTDDNFEKYAKEYHKKRAKKGMTPEQAKKILQEDKLFYGAMMVDQGAADGMVAGAISTTADTIRSIIHCVGTAPYCSIISSFFLMVVENKTLGENGAFLYADCGVNPNPNANQLAQIAITTAQSFKVFFDTEPRVAMLSFSTKGSAHHDDVTKVITATKLARELDPGLTIDGELQVDAAIVPKVALSKAPGSKVAGMANILIFPDLDAGNIAYKLTQRLANAIALGPIIQGAAKPVNDLSRGCSVDDIINVTAITAVQAEYQKKRSLSK